MEEMKLQNVQETQDYQDMVERGRFYINGERKRDYDSYSFAFTPRNNVRAPKVYYYTEEEVGVPWPGPDADFIVNGEPKIPGTIWPRFDWCALPGFVETTNMDEADVFVVRQRLIWLLEKQIRGLPCLRPDLMNRHIFFDLGSDGIPACFRDFPDIPAIFFRAAANKRMLKYTPTTIPWSWPVEDFTNYPLEPEGGFRYDVVYQGQNTGSTTEHITRALRDTPGLETHLMVTPRFYGTMRDGTERSQLRETFLDTLHYGRLSLVPGVHPLGVTRYRFYEALSMGRVPVYIDDNGVVPFTDRIDYRKCALFIPEAQLSRIGDILADWLNAHSDQDIMEMGRYGREMWKRWLDRSRWAEIVAEIVREKLTL